MSEQLDKAKEMLFGNDALRATNFKLFPGTSREATSDEIAAQISNSIAEIEAGEAEIIDC